MARAAVITAPTPVTTAHPTVARASKGTPTLTGTTPSSGTTAYCAKHAVPRKWAMSCPRARSFVAPDGSLLRYVVRSSRSHSTARPSRQVRARAARRRPAEDDVIAELDLRHAVADVAHDAGALVSEDDRRANRPVVVRGMEIAVTDARRLDLDRVLHPVPAARAPLLPQRVAGRAPITPRRG